MNRPGSPRHALQPARDSLAGARGRRAPRGEAALRGRGPVAAVAYADRITTAIPVARCHSMWQWKNQ